MSKTTILYKDIAPGAADDATVTATGGTGDLTQIPHGAAPGKLITLERSRWVLDGTFDGVYAEGKVGFGLRRFLGTAESLPTRPKSL